jgi:hypothetical protein
MHTEGSPGTNLTKSHINGSISAFVGSDRQNYRRPLLYVTPTVKTTGMKNASEIIDE